MICFVDMEHEQAFRHRKRRSVHQTYLADIRRRLEATSGDSCEIRPYTDVTPSWLDSAEVRALLISGNVTDWAAYDEESLQRLYRIVQDAAIPILGLCGGLQLIAMAHDAAVGPMGRLDQDDEDPADDYATGYVKEWGFKRVRVVESDPLFSGLDEPTFLQAHYWEVKAVPRYFRLLASTDACRIQALKRRGRVVYGTQFHPEAYILEPTDRENWSINLVYPAGYRKRQPDGYTLLRNFFQIAGVLR